MPGEDRPSLASVTPYDDDPEVLVSKVEQLCEQSRLEKEKLQQRKASKNANKAKNFDNLVDKIKDE